MELTRELGEKIGLMEEDVGTEEEIDCRKKRSERLGTKAHDSSLKLPDALYFLIFFYSIQQPLISKGHREQVYSYVA